MPGWKFDSGIFKLPVRHSQLSFPLPLLLHSSFPLEFRSLPSLPPAIAGEFPVPVVRSMLEPAPSREFRPEEGGIGGRRVLK